MAIDDQSAEAALLDIRGFAKVNRFEFRRHALERMQQRGVYAWDVHFALCNATGCVYQPENRRWKVAGPDLDGDELMLAVEIDDGLLVVTVF